MMMIGNVPVANARRVLLDSVYVPRFAQDNPDAPRSMLKNSVNRIAPDVDLTRSAHFISLRKRRTLHFGICNEHTGRITTVYTLELQVGDLFVLGPRTRMRYCYGFVCKGRRRK